MLEQLDSGKFGAVGTLAFNVVRSFSDGCGASRGITGCDPLGYFIYACTIKSPSKMSSSEVEQFYYKT